MFVVLSSVGEVKDCSRALASQLGYSKTKPSSQEDGPASLVGLPFSIVVHRADLACFNSFLQELDSNDQDEPMHQADCSECKPGGQVCAQLLVPSRSVDCRLVTSTSTIVHCRLSTHPSSLPTGVRALQITNITPAKEAWRGLVDVLVEPHASVPSTFYSVLSKGCELTRAHIGLALRLKSANAGQPLDSIESPAAQLVVTQHIVSHSAVAQIPSPLLNPLNIRLSNSSHSYPLRATHCERVKPTGIDPFEPSVIPLDSSSSPCSIFEDVRFSITAQMTVPVMHDGTCWGFVSFLNITPIGQNPLQNNLSTWWPLREQIRALALFASSQVAQQLAPRSNTTLPPEIEPGPALQCPLNKKLKERSLPAAVTSMYEAAKAAAHGGTTPEAKAEEQKAEGADPSSEDVTLKTRTGDVFNLPAAETVFDLSLDMLCLSNFSGFFTRVNPAYSRHLGWDFEEAMACPWIEFVHPDDRGYTTENTTPVRLRDAPPGTPSVVRNRCRWRCKDGSYKVLEWRGAAYPDLGVAVCVARDVTDDEERLKKLKEAKSLAEAAGRLKEDFLAHISHEIRTPLNGILGMSDLLVRTRLSEEQREFVEIITNCGQHLLSIIGDVLDLSKISSGNMELNFESVHLLKCIEQALGMANRSDMEQLQVLYCMDGDVPANLYTDPTRLRQILTNLLSNAFKFTARLGGEVMLTLRVTEGSNRPPSPAPSAVGQDQADTASYLASIHESGGYSNVSMALSTAGDEKMQPAEAFPAQQKPHYIEFCVRDTGCGVPKEQQHKLFKSFSQANSSVSREFGGAGLGLYVCSSLVTLLGGEIWMESEGVVGQGSRFFFTLPIKSPSHPLPAEVAAPSAMLPSPIPSMSSSMKRRTRSGDDGQSETSDRSATRQKLATPPGSAHPEQVDEVMSAADGPDGPVSTAPSRPIVVLCTPNPSLAMCALKMLPRYGYDVHQCESVEDVCSRLSAPAPTHPVSALFMDANAPMSPQNPNPAFSLERCAHLTYSAIVGLQRTHCTCAACKVLQYISDRRLPTMWVPAPNVNARSHTLRWSVSGRGASALANPGTRALPDFQLTFDVNPSADNTFLDTHATPSPYYVAPRPLKWTDVFAHLSKQLFSATMQAMSAVPRLPSSTSSVTARGASGSSQHSGEFLSPLPPGSSHAPSLVGRSSVTSTNSHSPYAAGPSPLGMPPASLPLPSFPSGSSAALVLGIDGPSPSSVAQLAASPSSTLAVPVRPSSQPTLSNAVPKPQAAAPARSQGNPRNESISVLVVEDNPINRKLLLRILSNLGFKNVASSVDGQEAIDAVKAQAFDVILMDIQMPNVDGLTATRTIRDLHHSNFWPVERKRPIIIAVTAHAMAGDKEQCLAAGMDGYITKPIDSTTISKTLDDWLSREAAPPAAIAL